MAPLVVAWGAVQGGRVAGKQEERSIDPVKFVAGVPVLNYDQAFKGAATEDAASQEEEWVVVTKVGTSDEDIEGLCKFLKGGCTFQGHPGKGGVPFFSFHGTEKELEAVIEKAGKNLVEFAEPDMPAYAVPEIKGDELSVAAASWGLDRIGSSSKSGSGVHVYVLDTGIRHSHTDFEGRAIPTIDLSTWSVCNGNTNCARDANGHGTHCAGTVAGNKYGVAPQATLHSAKVLGDDGSGSFSWTTTALDWISSNGISPRVASMSLGGPGVVGSIKTSIDSAVSSGVTVVVAAGNENMDACRVSPAYVPAAITVGSIDQFDRRSTFSNYGRCVNIWAPGSDIVSASHRSNSGSVSLSGTSMACPHVSGGAALLLQSSRGWNSVAVLNSMLNSGEWGSISGLRSGDTNLLLKVR